MPKFMYRLRYTKEGLEGTIKEGFANRERYIHQIFESGGGSVEAVYWAYGDDDAFIIADLPDGATAVGTSLIANLRGGFRASTTPLLTAAEMDAAVAKIPDYRPPVDLAEARRRPRASSEVDGHGGRPFPSRSRWPAHRVGLGTSHDVLPRPLGEASQPSCSRPRSSQSQRANAIRTSSASARSRGVSK